MKKNNKKKIGLTAGSFDLTHAGHFLMFKECRRLCDYLVVALQTDPSIDRKEKNKPIQSLKERLIQLDSCKWIDEIIIYKTEAQLYDILKTTKPDVRFLGEDHKGKPFTGDDINGIKIIFNSRNHNYSTSNLREQVFFAEYKKRVLNYEI